MRIAENSQDYIRNYNFDENLSIAQQAEEYIKSYFWDIRKIKLVKKSKGESGFDLRDECSTLFVEVKGSEKSFKNFPGCYFTDLEYKKAKSCQKEKRRYEIHLVVGIGSESPEHYMWPGKLLLDKAKKEVWFSLTGKDFRNYDC